MNPYRADPAFLTPTERSRPWWVRHAGIGAIGFIPPGFAGASMAALTPCAWWTGPACIAVALIISAVAMYGSVAGEKASWGLR